ncbi:MAG: hypothetical protein QOJ83_2672, partial [Frankiales bacterium]|nr:hypothetical protein [Frankiales bacterium]
RSARSSPNPPAGKSGPRSMSSRTCWPGVTWRIGSPRTRLRPPPRPCAGPRGWPSGLCRPPAAGCRDEPAASGVVTFGVGVGDQRPQPVRDLQPALLRGPGSRAVRAAGTTPLYRGQPGYPCLRVPLPRTHRGVIREAGWQAPTPPSLRAIHVHISAEVQGCRIALVATTLPSSGEGHGGKSREGHDSPCRWATWGPFLASMQHPWHALPTMKRRSHPEELK